MTRFICSACGAAYAIQEPRWKCDCGHILDLSFEPRFPIDHIRNRKPTMWRYKEAIPLWNEVTPVSFDEGFTPLLAVEIENRPVYIKQEHLFQTGSYKDRGASVLLSVVNALGISRVVEDSSGNAGAAIAAYGAAAGIACDIYVPADTSPAKLSQIQGYGASLHKIPGTRDDTARAIWEAAQTMYYASHSWNPFFFHGTKTFAFEVVEQLGWKAPDTVILPVGNGTLLLGAALGFSELQQAGIIQTIPRLIGVQAEHCAPLYYKNKNITDFRVQKTLAEGIAIASPIRGEQIMEAVNRSGGYFIAVGEDEIPHALAAMSRKGFWIEPTAAATIAGVRRYLLQEPDPQEILVSAFTGHGLKRASAAF
ncbi:MAG: threonine synthase [Candidatus Omnitrophota bacterium]